MSELAPLQLIFDQPLASVQNKLEQFVAVNGDYFLDNDHQQNGLLSKFQHGSLGFDFDWSMGPVSLSGYRTVFMQAHLPSESTILGIRLGDNLGGGERSPPIAMALLALGAKLSAALGGMAVKWNPGKLVSDPAYFIESVEGYISGGAFPVLVTVDFDLLDEESRLQSTGLAWFSGQEIELRGNEILGQDLVRRAVRLVHDIAAHGPISEPQYVADIDAAMRLELMPVMDEGLLRCRITSKMEQENGVFGMC